MNTNSTKDTIYIDVDDDITNIIDKVRTSKDKIVALVLPKRASALQSIVNMKLLKRSVDESHKNLVLITSEAGLLPLAGAVGLHVAKTLQSKPAVPEPPETSDEIMETVGADEVGDAPVDETKPVGELAGLPAAPEEETINVDNEAEDESKKGSKKKKNKKLKVPNFESFRAKLFLGVGGFILLILLWILFTKVLPKANIVITTDSSTVSASVDFTSDSGAQSLDESAKILPATQKTFSKTDSEKVTASGQKDLGTKAKGTVTLKNCAHADGGVTVPAGTSVTTSSLTFITQSDVALPASAFSGGGSCISGTKDVGVQAQNAGDQYNLSGGRTFTVNGYPNVNGVDSSAMTGGTTKVVKVVSQADVDGAKQKILDRNSEPAKAELTKQLQAGKLFGITDTFNAGSPTITSSPNVGEEASDVTVNAAINYTMLGVKNDDLNKILENEVKKHIDTGKQTILNNGLDKAQSHVTDKKSDTNVKVNLSTNAEAGPQLDSDAIKKAIAGKKRGDTQSIITARPGIKDVKITYSPFWIGGTPHRTSRIKITFIQPNGQPSKQ